MGIFDFLKDAGDDDQDGGLSDEQFADLKTGNTVARKILGSGIEVHDMNVDFDDGTVVLEGRVADQATREKAVLIAGNTRGVAHVDDRLQVGANGENGTFPTRLHRVQKGDTLSEIAQERLGDASRWREIFEANQPMLDDPDRIYPGQVLRMPH